MVIAARRVYSDLLRWMKAARPRGLRPGRLAARLFRTIYLGAFLVLATIGLVRPSRFGSPTSRPLRSAEWLGLALLTAIAAGVTLARRQGVSDAIRRLREPFGRPFDHHPSYEPAAAALDSCPGPLRTRFALGWVWGPAGAVVLAAFFAASSAYFIVDAILARFEIGWQQLALTGIQAVLSLFVLRIAATRLSTWRLALSVHRSVAGGYV